jgi:hypothetical protein
MNETLALIFSYKRPLQLYACLESFKKMCCDYEKIDVNVLLRLDKDKFNNAYMEIVSENSEVKFTLETNFQKNILDLLKGYNNVIFLTDDNIFVENFYIQDINKFLSSNSKLLGFSLRLGLNTIYCYPVSKKQEIPTNLIYNKNMILWEWKQAELDFGYPLEVSSSVYKIKDIEYVLNNCQFSNPNEMEFVLDYCKGYFLISHPLLASYKKSVAFCAPVNKVKENNQNKSGLKKENSVDSLLTKFENGDRINIDKLIGFTPNACHQEITFDFYHT